MAELNPYPFGALVTRMFRELRSSQAIFDLPARLFHLGDPDRDLSVRFHGHRASSPLGPAAGPHSQMAQNIVLSWLGGARIIELKTVQVLDRLEIPRPCIDMQTVGYNIEWSQELRLEQSLEEYVKGSMLIDILMASGELPVAPGFDDVLYDMSVGYDLAGIKSAPVQAFIRGMMDASDVVDRLRRQLPVEFKRFRDLDFTTRLSDTLTLSTFHGCPPDEIEAIIDLLLREVGLHCIVKLNPMLLGKEQVRHLLHDVLGYRDLRAPDRAFERDLRWEQAVELVERLGATAAALELGFGVKFTNTLVVENHRDFFPATAKEMYLSGRPLHVLAMHLVQRCRRHFGDRHPISFSAGIERANFPDAVALGLVPVTVCTDLLKPGGYGRARSYCLELGRRMGAVGAETIDDFIIRACGHGEAALDSLDPAPSPSARRTCVRALREGRGLRRAAGDELHRRWVARAKLLNTESYVPAATANPRYARERNSKVPRKIGRQLALFDCLTCDKCVPVCPNDANFTFVLPPTEIPIVKLQPGDGGGWERRQEGSLTIGEQHQIGTFADFCNDCGNCDVFCPEDGGPYVMKPRFFGSLERWRQSSPLDGFYLESGEQGDVVYGRFDRRDFRLRVAAGRASYSGDGFAVRFDAADPEGTIEGEVEVESEVDMTYFSIMNHLRRALYASSEVNYVNCLG